MHDFDPQITAVRRQVGRKELAKGEAAVVTISQAYDTDVEDLWAACTTSDRLVRWFAPVSGDLTPGGRYQIEGNASGTVQSCDPPKSFSLTWEYDETVSWVEVHLSSEATGGSRFELAHTSYLDDHWDQYGPGAVGLGYDLSLLGLAQHLSAGFDARGLDFAAFLAAAETKRFLTAAGELWYEADVAGGTAADKARGAADRAIAAFTTT